MTPYQNLQIHSLMPFYRPGLHCTWMMICLEEPLPALSALRIQKKKSLGAFDFTNGADGFVWFKGNPALAGTALDDAVFGTLLMPAPGMPDRWILASLSYGCTQCNSLSTCHRKNGNHWQLANTVNNFLPNGWHVAFKYGSSPTPPEMTPISARWGLIRAAVLGLTAAHPGTNTNINLFPIWMVFEWQKIGRWCATTMEAASRWWCRIGLLVFGMMTIFVVIGQLHRIY